MATEKQIAANRRNAQKSTGPKTREGKERARRNATTHGLSAITTIYHPIRHEDPDQFAELRARLFADCRPVGTAEELAVEMMASAFRRIQRVEAMETEFLTGAMGALQMKHGKPIEPSEVDDLGCGIVVLGDRRYKLSFESIDRYRRAAWADYNRSVEQLRRLQKDRLDRPVREHRARLATLEYEKLTRAAAALPASSEPPSRSRLVTMEAELASFCQPSTVALSQGAPERPEVPKAA